MPGIGPAVKSMWRLKNGIMTNMPMVSPGERRRIAQLERVLTRFEAETKAGSSR